MSSRFRKKIRRDKEHRLGSRRRYSKDEEEGGGGRSEKAEEVEEEEGAGEEKEGAKASIARAQGVRSDCGAAG